MRARTNKRWAWVFIILISVLFFFGLSLVLSHAVEGSADINIVHDSYAETQTYETFFLVFTEELLRFMEENRDKISGRHRVFVMEFYRVFDPTDIMIFIYLDLNMALKEPLLIHRERVRNLNSSESVKTFAKKTVENLVRIIGENGPKKREI
ncbi:MAG: hypothetical protein ABIG73_01160 [Patescibacteria group bacterium]